jgi:hypothetical protein
MTTLDVEAIAEMRDAREKLPAEAYKTAMNGGGGGRG